MVESARWGHVGPSILASRHAVFHTSHHAVNEINAVSVDDHVWTHDGPDAELYGLEPNYGCCTANFNQGKISTYLRMVLMPRLAQVCQHALLLHLRWRNRFGCICPRLGRPAVGRVHRCYYELSVRRQCDRDCDFFEVSSPVCPHSRLGAAGASTTVTCEGLRASSLRTASSNPLRRTAQW